MMVVEGEALLRLSPTLFIAASGKLLKDDGNGFFLHHEYLLHAYNMLL
jgi:hypothetical protein